MVKVRLQGLPDEVATIAEAMEAVGCVMERSKPYANRGSSRYVRVYMDCTMPEEPELARGGDEDDRR